MTTPPTDEQLRSAVLEHMVARVGGPMDVPGFAGEPDGAWEQAEAEARDAVATLEAMIEADFFDEEHEGVGSLARQINDNARQLAQKSGLD